MTRHKPFLRWLTILLFPVCSWSATCFFSMLGNDANPGTESQPKKGLGHAASLIGPGTTIKLKRGDTWYIGVSKWEVAGKKTALQRDAGMLDPVVSFQDTGLFARFVHH